MVDKFVEGSSTAGTVKSAGLPNITGNLSKAGTTGVFDNATGSFSGNDSSFYAPKEGGTKFRMVNVINFNASSSSSIYGKSNTVQPPALTMLYIIKY